LSNPVCRQTDRQTDRYTDIQTGENITSLAEEEAAMAQWFTTTNWYRSQQVGHWDSTLLDN